MCMFSSAPEPVYSNIEIFDAKTGTLVQKFDGPHLIIISAKNKFDIYKVLKMNPTTTDETPVFSTDGIDQKFCAKCQNGVFDDIKEASPDEIAGAHIFSPPPDPDDESIDVNLARKLHQQYSGVSLHDGPNYFCIYKSNALLACYTKTGFTHKP